VTASYEVEDQNLHLHYLALPTRRVVPNILRSVFLIQKTLELLRPDVVNSHTPPFTVASLRAGLPTLFTIHGVVHREAPYYRASLFDRLRFALEKWFERQALRRTTEIVAINPYIQDVYSGWTRGRFHLIENALSLDLFSLPNREEENRLLYAGSVSELKNIIGLLEAVAIVRENRPDVRLRVAGKPAGRFFQEKIFGFIEGQHLESNVQLLGLLDRDDLLDEYSRCAAVVLASHQETAPMAVMEAMAAGKPVITTRVGGTAYLVEDRKTGFVVEPGDQKGLALRIGELLRDDDLRRDLGQQAREQAQRFRPEATAAKYRQLYYQVAGRLCP
jgi:glycosyltransferase involved in cell wall biosynthesis